jgi:ABC-type bacteriocin/lantibiotic exporter with double-glycine peptidase domain
VIKDLFSFSHSIQPVLQMEAAECGAACLTMILQAHGRVVSLEETRERCGTSRDGVNAGALAKAAESYGLQVKALRCEPEELADLPLPAILHWNFDHFVVLNSVRGKRYELLDPATGRRFVDHDEMNRSLTGLVLAMAPGEAFQAGGKKPSVLKSLIAQTQGSRDGMALVFLCGVMGLIPGLVLSGLIQTFTDYVVGQDRKEWLFVILGALVGTILVQMALAALKEWTVAALKAKIGTVIAAKAFHHALFLPFYFFAQRNAGEIVSRLRIGSEIAGTVAGPLAQMLPHGVVAAGYLAVMFLYDSTLGLIVALIALSNLGLMVHFSKKLTEANRLHNVLEGVAGGVATSGFTAFEAFRMLGREDMFARRWLAAEEAALDAEQRLGALRTFVTLGPTASALLITMSVLTIGAWQVMAGELTLGSLLAMQVLAGLVSAPIAALAHSYCSLQEAAGAIMRLEDMIKHPQEKLLLSNLKAGEAVFEEPQDQSLVLQSIRFGFGTHQDLFSDIELCFEPGVLSAVTGPSGAGKSTLAKLAAGMISPRGGTIMLGGRPLEHWPHDLLRKKLAYVPQTSAVMSASIRDNLTMWDDTVSDEAIEDALDLAGARDFVARAGGVATMLSSHQPGLSGGEIQRLALARALVHKPWVLVLDETTSALDAVSEQAVLEGLLGSGASVLLVTHRQGSRQRCDRIIHLDGKGGCSVTQNSLPDNSVQDLQGLLTRAREALKPAVRSDQTDRSVAS